MKAVEWAEQVVPADHIYARAHACAVLAMAHWQLGNKEQARERLATGESLAPAIVNRTPGNDYGGVWVAWLYARLCLNEAKTIIRAENDASISAEK